MNNEAEILRELRALRSAVTSRVDRMEDMLTKTGDAVVVLDKQMAQNSTDIQNLYTILATLMEERGIQRPHGTAIPKEELYRRLAKEGISRNSALQTLSANGTIRQDSQGKNTVTARVNGKTVRVILVRSDGSCKR